MAFLMMDVRILIASMAACFLLVRLLSIGMRNRNMPPGPPTLPIIGNLHQIPKKDIHLHHQKWAKEYGPIFSLKLGSQDVIILASGDMIKRLVDKRSGNYADRPALFMQDIFEHSRIIMRGYDDLWKVERKLYHQFLNSTKAARYTSYQDLETKQLCFDLLNRPQDFEALITRTTLSAATSMAYGFRVTNPDNPVMKELLHNAHGFFTMVHKSQLFDWYPQLRSIARWLPPFLYPMYRDAREIFRREKAQFHQLLSDTKKTMTCENSLPSFASDIVRAQKSWEGKQEGTILTDHAAAYIAGIAMEGATDTQSNQLAGFIKAMMLYPDVQKQAHVQLDDIVGTDRLPEPSDLENLPYIRQIMKETLRWMPTAVTGAIPHSARAQDEIDGYIIPKGATILLAVWAANNDPALFPNPRVFDPSRQNPNFTMGEAALASDIHDRDHWTFGAGRRICPGIHVAEGTLLLAMARILWAFDIAKAKDAQGREIEVDQDELTQSIAARPLPFK
ncbi:uncharacterized protein Z519_12256 [Cladophialophora bantiana CBS 173.52]|uniref:Cytochrome P450 oxidoreductase n=1 Tax=Cladophialophora bantiana (strain ATCC 10958 / CBS 173.52 / CDC B-1940 / NIH 8579) TaxID=1442370 RepID=A0A0D2H8D1_CLAB1|nr:uncharacterized protein Z519_12256 [Cladophialophora bantiana CBS 173.52]KIW87145.1 hypothetical protein Z519_12256 [Cladophialophora bantiana CBS 173.52]